MMMASTLVQFRADETERSLAIQILDQLGMDLPSYLRMSLARLVSEKGIPFSMKLDAPTENKGTLAMKRASRIAEEYGLSHMSLDEINAEIDAVRSQGEINL